MHSRRLLYPHSRWRHKRRQTIYLVLAVGLLQASDGDLHNHEGEQLVVYRDISSQQVWVRPLREFLDGRFEPLHPSRQLPE